MFVETVGVSLADLDARLMGFHVDEPKAGSVSGVNTIGVTGWILGREVEPVAVEIVHGHAVIRRVPLQDVRLDVAAAYPHVVGAERSGFRTRIDVPGGTSEVELALRGVLRDQHRVPLATIRVRRRWLDRDNCDGAALVSVIIPCYNQAHFLDEAIESVLAQAYAHFEIVVVDDGSTDNTSQVAARYPGVRCIRQSNQGLAAARNTGLRESNGRYLVFLDADDRLLPNALEIGVKELNSHPESALAFGRFHLIDAAGKSLTKQLPRYVGKDHYRELLLNNFIWTTAVVIYRRSVFQFVRGFDPIADGSEDYHLYLRVAQKFPIHYHDQTVSEYRQHGANMNTDSARMLISSLMALRSQWRSIKYSPENRRSYKKGIQAWKRAYGDILVKDILDLMWHRNWESAGKKIKVLCLYYPRGFVQVIRAIGFNIRNRVIG